jgi:hypothetical protein
MTNVDGNFFLIYSIININKLFINNLFRFIISVYLSGYLSLLDSVSILLFWRCIFVKFIIVGISCFRSNVFVYNVVPSHYSVFILLLKKDSFIVESSIFSYRFIKEEIIF